jgi:hypothetical protein
MPRWSLSGRDGAGVGGLLGLAGGRGVRIVAAPDEVGRVTYPCNGRAVGPAPTSAALEQGQRAPASRERGGDGASAPSRLAREFTFGARAPALSALRKRPPPGPPLPLPRWFARSRATATRRPAEVVGTAYDKPGRRLEIAMRQIPVRPEDGGRSGGCPPSGGRTMRGAGARGKRPPLRARARWEGSAADGGAAGVRWAADQASAAAPAPVRWSRTRWNSVVGEKSTYSLSSSASGAWPGAQ